VQHAHTLPSSSIWRAATLVVGAIAALELVALLVLAGVRLAPAHRHAAATPAKTTVAHTHTSVRAPQHVAAHPLRPRGRVRVLVWNGNCVAGAAGAEAQQLSVAGYHVAGATNAPRHDYARSVVMYAPGWSAEAHRLARDAHVRLVGPLDGLRASQLRGSKLVLLLGT
jgi:LytR cell envelope-related transcriptional attenuator